MPCETVEVTTEGAALDTWTHLICGPCRSTYKTLILYALLPTHYKCTAFLCGPWGFWTAPRNRRTDDMPSLCPEKPLSLMDIIIEKNSHVTCGKDGTPQQWNVILERAEGQFARIEYIRFLTSNNRCSGYNSRNHLILLYAVVIKMSSGSSWLRLHIFLKGSKWSDAVPRSKGLMVPESYRLVDRICSKRGSVLLP